MSLIYALVAHEKTVLVEHTTSTGNFITLTRTLLDKLPSDRSMMSYIYGEFTFNYIMRNGLVYMVLADKELGFNTPFRFLEDICIRFEAQYGKAGLEAIAYAMQHSFEPIVEQRIRYHQQHLNDPHMTLVQGKIDNIQQVMSENIDKLLSRGERIELLVCRTEQLSEESVEFRRHAGRLKRRMWWRSIKYFVYAGMALIALLWIIGISACGGWTFPSCRNVNQKEEVTTQPKHNNQS